MAYSPAKIPTFVDLQQAGQFFQNELAKIADAFTETRELELRESFRSPERPRDGMIVFADGTHWDPGNGRGPYYFDTTWTAFTTGGGGGYSDEQARDAIAAAFAAGTQTGITFAYDDTLDSYSLTVTTPTYTDEQAQDAVGSILTDSPRIDLNYDDSGPSITADILANSVDDSRLRQSVGLSVIGRSAVTAGNVADLTAAVPGDILRVDDTGLFLGFGPILSTSVFDFSERTEDIIGAHVVGGTGIFVSYNDTTGDTTITNIGAVYTDEEAQDAVGGILVDSARIDFTYNDGVPSITADIIANSIGDTQLRQGAAMSVIGRGANTVGDVADITATFAGAVLRANIDGTAIAFGLITSASMSDFTEAAQDATGAMVGASLVYTDATPLLARAALTGDITAAADSNATTLATVNANVGTFGSATQTVTVTYNAKGLATAVAQQNIAIPASQVTDFAEATDDRVAALATEGTGIDITYDDTLNTLTFAVDPTAFDSRWVNTSGDTMTGGLQGIAGAAGSPAFSVDGQGGLFSSAAAHLNIDVAGTELIRFDGTNRRMGIGEAFDPDEVVHVRRSTGNSRFLLQGNSGTIFKGHRFSADISGPAFVIAKSRGSVAVPANPNQNDLFGTLSFGGSPTTANADFWGGVVLSATALAVTPSSAARDSSFNLALGTGSGASTVFQWDLTDHKAFGRTWIDSNSLFLLRSTTVAGAFTGAAAKLAYFTDNGGDVYTHNGTAYTNVNNPTTQTIATDAAFTVTPNSSGQAILHTGTLTANRAVTLAAGQRGDWCLITRTGGGAFNLDVGTGPLKSLATNTWGKFIVNAAGAWYLAAYGAL